MRIWMEGNMEIWLGAMKLSAFYTLNKAEEKQRNKIKRIDMSNAPGSAHKHSPRILTCVKFGSC